MVEHNQKSNGKRWWGRRVLAWAVWFVGLNFNFYYSVLNHIDFEWFSEYALYSTLGLGLVLGGISATDLVKFKRQ